MALNYLKKLALAASAVMFSAVADDAGVVPETSVVLVNAGDSEGREAAETDCNT